MPRLTQLDLLLFPVEEHPIFASVKSASGERRLSIPDKKAIVNRDRGRVLGVVSRGYRLVSNLEALEMARECCHAVFPETKPGEWEVRATDAPGTGGHCFIDLAHNSTNLDFTLVPARDRLDAYGPFIRVTNSYNGLRALSFGIGFYRKVCENSLILPESIIRFKFPHARSKIGKTIQFEVAHEKLSKLRASMSEYLGVLQDYPVGRDKFQLLLLGVLSLRKPKDAKPGSPEAEDWSALNCHLTSICDRYAGELGENAYAALNAMTEFASHPPENRCVYAERHTFQCRAGAWLNDFKRVCRTEGFDLDKYIEKITSNGNGTATVTTAHGRRS